MEHQSWWKRNWKWLVPIFGVMVIAMTTFFSSGMDGIVTDMAQAYGDTELYENALEIVKSDPRAIELLGEIEPIDKFAILEGTVGYSDGNNTVNSSIRVLGTKGKATMDISANRINNAWTYKKINIRIKKPIEDKQTIEIIKME